MSMGSSPPDSLNLLPMWLELIGVALFMAVLASHARHAAESHGARRVWHYGHVLLAASMAETLVPHQLFNVGISAAICQDVLAAVLIVLSVCAVAALAGHRAPSMLWLLVALDAVAMIYMWAPSHSAPVSEIVVAYLLLESLLWGSDRIRVLDRPLIGGSFTLDGGGSIGIAATVPVTSHRDLRVPMCAMTLGMAYMVLAMQLMS